MQEPPGPARHADGNDESRVPFRGEPFSVASLLATGLRHGHLILLCGAAFVLLQTARRLLPDATYTSSAIFMTERTTTMRGQVGELARRLGFGAPDGNSRISPSVLEQLLGSRPVMDSVARGLYEVVEDDRLMRATLPEILEVKARSPEGRARRVRGWLRSAVHLRVDLPTGLIYLQVRTKWPRLSQAVAERMVEEVDWFNIQLRQERALRTEAFIAERIAEVVEEKDSAEAALQGFRAQNRVYGEWSPLSVQADRLAAEVVRLQLLYASLMETHSDAQIEAVRDTPVVTVLQQPFLPHRPDSRGLGLGIPSAFLTGCLLAFLAVFVVEHYRNSASASRAQLLDAARQFLDQLPFLRRIVRP